MTTIATTTSPVVTTVDVAGTCALLSTVAVTVADSSGATVGPAAATVIGTAWSVTALNVAALADGTLIVQATETPSAGALAFAAKATTKRSRSATHVTCEPWASAADVRGEVPTGLTVADLDEACWIASDILFLLSGSQWPGTCTDKVRPQARYRAYDRAAWWQTWQSFTSMPVPYSRYGWCSCNRGKDFGCSTIPEIELPHGPVDVDSVVVTEDGVVLDDADYTILDRRWLARTDGNGWRCCQRTELPDTEIGTWSVSYSFGALPDAGGTWAAAALGFQWALSIRRDDACKLPRRVQTITRAGTTIALIDPMTLFGDGLTGLTEVDLWLVSKIVGNKRRPATIGTVGKSPRFRRDAS